MLPLFKEYINIFRRKNEKATTFNEDFFEPITLNLKCDEKDIPFKDKARMPRQYSEDKIEQANKLFDELRKQEFIRPSKAVWVSLLVIIQKKDGSYRVAVDYTKLNQYLEDDPYEIPHINTILQKLARHKIFSILDFTAAYHQFKLREVDKHLTTVFFPGKGKFE